MPPSAPCTHLPRERETSWDTDLLLWVPEPHATAEGKAECVLYAAQVTPEKPLARHLDL
jgi:hypothetical protein